MCFSNVLAPLAKHDSSLVPRLSFHPHIWLVRENLGTRLNMIAIYVSKFLGPLYCSKTIVTDTNILCLYGRQHRISLEDWPWRKWPLNFALPYKVKPLIVDPLEGSASKMRTLFCSTLPITSKRGHFWLVPKCPFLWGQQASPLLLQRWSKGLACKTICETTCRYQPDRFQLQ